MFGTKTRRRPVRRAFHPDAFSRLEGRELLSTLVPSGTATVYTSSGPTSTAMINHGSYANYHGNTPAALNRNAPTSGGTTFNHSFSTTVRSTAPVATTSLNLNVPNGGRLPTIRTGVSSAESNPAFASSTGLAFTNGLGFTNPFVGTSSAQNGLAFTNGLGFSTPFAGTNSAQNGLAFTNGLGFSTPFVGTNSAQNGLAFTNGQGFASPFVGTNSATNGLAFTNGQGFSTPFTGTTSGATNGLVFNNGLGTINPLLNSGPTVNNTGVTNALNSGVPSTTSTLGAGGLAFTNPIFNAGIATGGVGMPSLGNMLTSVNAGFGGISLGGSAGTFLGNTGIGSATV